MENEKTTLGLNLPTDPRWINIAEKQIADILIDHAFCEQKAATSGITLIVQYPEKTELVETMTALVTEEWGHFKAVLNKMKDRGIKLGKARKDEYVAAVNKIMKSGGSRQQQLTEKLLLNALIEARSAERFKLLWKNIKDPDLAQFYHELMVSEAGHYHTFLELAKLYDDSDYVNERWREFLIAEAEIMKGLEIRPDRMH
ncbi:tRNA-(ms[2]io[6]A)-hydroxylase [Reichenbachiella versicolor]|uniref:tRNA-(ms[2]io[6]A)-hydroxylase n=1 Tax=Reichenbachiella versicolor TaxID=1821036 RepID=UPI000D6E960A|nr:tRNA-(ms[2]io[6]A)-hydroxylase [Reichenbachiella versicolor]